MAILVGFSYGLPFVFFVVQQGEWSSDQVVQEQNVPIGYNFQLSI